MTEFKRFTAAVCLFAWFYVQDTLLNYFLNELLEDWNSGFKIFPSTCRMPGAILKVYMDDLNTLIITSNTVLSSQSTLSSEVIIYARRHVINYFPLASVGAGEN